MSEATQAALDQAVLAHIADAGDGAFCTGWLMIASSVTGDQLADDTTSYISETSDHLPLHAALGLAQMLDHHLRDAIGEVGNL